MTTTFNTYSPDVPHERECIFQTKGAILQSNGSGITVANLKKGKNLVAVMASLCYLLEKGMVRREGSLLGCDDLTDDENIFPVLGTVFKK